MNGQIFSAADTPENAVDTPRQRLQPMTDRSSST